MGTGSFPGVKCGRGVLLTTHPFLVPQSWKSRAIPLHRLGHTGPVTGSVYLYLPRQQSEFKPQSHWRVFDNVTSFWPMFSFVLDFTYLRGQFHTDCSYGRVSVVQYWHTNISYWDLTVQSLEQKLKIFSPLVSLFFLTKPYLNTPFTVLLGGPSGRAF